MGKEMSTNGDYEGLEKVTKERPDQDFRSLVMDEELKDVGICKTHDIYQTVYLLAKRIKDLEERPLVKRINHLEDRIEVLEREMVKTHWIGSK